MPSAGQASTLIAVDAFARRIVDALPTARSVVLVRDRCGRIEVVDAVLSELSRRGVEVVLESVSNARLRELIGGSTVERLNRWDIERAADTARVAGVIGLGGWRADLDGLAPELVAAWVAAIGRVEAALELRRVPTVMVAVATTEVAEKLGMLFAALDVAVHAAVVLPASELNSSTAPVLEALGAASTIELRSGLGSGSGTAVLTVERSDRVLLVDDGVVDEDDVATGAVVSNLPAGSVYWTIVEDTARGSLQLADGTVLHFGDDGRVIDGDYRGERIGHIGVATNPLVTTDIGWTIVDEHRAGAVFVSLGENRYMGGANESAINVDLLPADPTLVVDGVSIVADGHLRLIA